MVMYSLSQEVLRTDISGMPLEWIDYRDAVRLYFMGQVAYSFGQRLFRLRGGTNAATLTSACTAASNFRRRSCPATT
jgi:hypothetical protein